MSNEGKIAIQADIIPNNDNPRMSVTDAKYVKGAPQVFGTITELVEFHPNRMKKGMTVTVFNWPSANSISKFTLNSDPELLKNSSGDSIININNFNQFWEIESQQVTSQSKVRQYAPDGPGGGTPTYPYTLPTESEWSTTLDFTKGHKWMRFRDDDIDDNSDGIFDNWSVPIAILNAFQTGDYIDKRFKREGVISSFNTIHSGTGTLVNGNYYLVDSNSVQITGDLSLNDVGEQGQNTSIVLTLGRVFKYDSSNAYDFNYSGTPATVIRTIKTPPRTTAGLTNNEPSGWFDTPPVGTDQLWEISGQKSVYGQLKSDWILKKVSEDPEYTRYSNSPSPHPDTIVDTNTTAAASTVGDLALDAAGWSKTYTGQNFIARRSDNDSPPPSFTPWLVEKISEESGEYVDRVFKLFDINLDSDSVLLNPPIGRDPSDEGWSDTPVEETDLKINYVSEARKFFDGTLKTSWSKPIPYTGRDVFTDTIESLSGDNFKYDVLGAVSPSLIPLQANLYKGETSLWEQPVQITYQWKKVYNGGAVVDISPTTNSLDDFYLFPVIGSGAADSGGSSTTLIDSLGSFVSKGVSVGDKIWNVTDGSYATVTVINSATQLTTTTLTGGTDNTWSSGDTYFLQVDGYYRENQRVVVKPGAVDGSAIFRVTQTIVMPDAENIIFEEEFSIIDVTDGKDAKTLTVTADAQRFLYDTVNAVFSPLGLVLRVYQSNIPSPTYYWYKWNGVSWDALSNGVGGYLITGNALITTAANIFTADAVGQEFSYAVSTHPTDPDAADYENTFSDFITITKLSAANIGVDGVNAISAILSNESHTVVLDSTTGVPAAGEVAKATTRLTLFDGPDKLDYNSAEFTVTLGPGESTYFNVSVDPSDTESALISLINSSWVSGQIGYVANLTITYGAISVTKKFTLASTSDAPGAILLDIDSDKGYEFTPTDKTNKTLTARLYNSSLTGNQLITLPDAAYQFRWRVAGVWGSLSTGNYTRVITRADIQSSSQVTVEVYIDGGATLYRSRTISMSDVVDGRSYRAWTDATSLGGNILTNQDPTSAFGGGTVVVGSVTWRLQSSSYWNANQPVYAQDASVDPVSGNWVWSPAYRIKGEQGDQGGSGNFFFELYKSTEKILASETSISDFAAASGSYTFNKGAVILLSDPASVPYYYNGGTKTSTGSYSTSQVAPDYGAGGTTSSYAQMNAAGWVTGLLIPNSGVIWKTSRLWDGNGVTFDGNGVPSTSPVGGSSWSTITRVSSVDGRSFAGTNGTSGASPIHAVVAGVNAGEKVMQLIGWIGTAPSPSHINEYLSSSGYVANIALATVVSGTPVELRYDTTTGFIQWKYTDEGSGAWRSLVTVAPDTYDISNIDLSGSGTGYLNINTPLTSAWTSIFSTVQFTRRLRGYLKTGRMHGVASSANFARIDVEISVNGAGAQVIGTWSDQFTSQTDGLDHIISIPYDAVIPAASYFQIRVVITPLSSTVRVFRTNGWTLYNQLIAY